MTNPAEQGLFPELAQLQRQAAALSGTLRAAEAAAAEASGRDPSGQVRVVLEPSGRIDAVQVESGSLTAAGLGPAVLAAYQEAGRRRLETWSAEISRAKDADPAVVEPPVAEATLVAADPSGDDAHDAVRRLFYLLQDATDQLGEVAREAAERATTTVTGSDPADHVVATFVGGELTGLRVDERWAAGADGRESGTALTAAITRGYAAVDRLAENAPATRWPFPDLDRLTSDPAALLSSIGLPAPARPRTETEEA